MTIPKYILLVVSLLMLPACATVISGTEQEMTFNSQPQGALVLVDGLAKGRTPVTVKLRKSEYQDVIFRKEGYLDKQVALKMSMDPLAWVNIFWDYSSTDALTGAIFEYEPSAYFVTLEKMDGKHSNTFLDLKHNEELTHYVFMYYDKIRQRCLDGCDDDHADMLAWLVARKYQKDDKTARVYAIQALAVTEDPIAYLRQLESDVQAGTHQVAAPKGNL